jgi:hypothetical protein
MSKYIVTEEKIIRDWIASDRGVGDYPKEKVVYLSWLKRIFDERLNSHYDLEGDLASLICRIEMEEKK